MAGSAQAANIHPDDAIAASTCLDVINPTEAHTLFEQVTVVGEYNTYLAVLVVVEPEQWSPLCEVQDWDANTANTLLVQEFVLQRIAAQMNAFRGYGKVRQVHIGLQAWTIEAGLLTPTLRVKRPMVMARFDNEIAQFYAGHGVHKS